MNDQFMGRWLVFSLIAGRSIALHFGNSAQGNNQRFTHPPGVLHDFPLSKFPPEWTIHYHHPFSQPMRSEDLFPGQAIGERQRIENALDTTPNDLMTTFVNGIYWYIGPTSEWYFAGVAEINDIKGTPANGDEVCVADCNSRISWIVNSTFGGYFRSGDQGFSLGVPVPLSDTWRKVVAYGPCELIEDRTTESPIPPFEEHFHPHGHGDPHMTNVKGERFDIFKTGNLVMLQIPRGETEVDNSLLQVVTNIMPMRNLTCSPIFIGKVQFSGRLLGYQTFHVVPSARGHPVVMIGNQPANITQFGNVTTSFNKVHGVSITMTTAKSNATITIWQHIKPKYDYFKYFNIEAEGLEAFGADIGGLLGYDNHADISKKRPECWNRKEANSPQLLVSSAHVKMAKNKRKKTYQ